MTPMKKTGVPRERSARRACSAPASRVQHPSRASSVRVPRPMPFLTRLRAVTAHVLFAAAFADVLIRRAGYGAAGLRLKSDAPWLAAWENLAATAGSFPERCLFYSGLLAVTTAAVLDLVRGGRGARATALLTLAAAATATTTALTGTPPPGHHAIAALAALGLAARAARIEKASDTLARRCYGFGAALALGGDALHRIWAALVLRRSSHAPACEQAAEIAVLAGITLAGLSASGGPRRKLGLVLALAAGGGAAVTAILEPGGASHVVRQLFDLGQAGLPANLTLGLAVAAIAAAAAAFATPAAAPALFILLASARHVSPAASVAFLAAGLLCVARRERKAPSPL